MIKASNINTRPCPVCGNFDEIKLIIIDEYTKYICCQSCKFQTNYHMEEKSVLHYWNSLPESINSKRSIPDIEDEKDITDL